MQDDEAKFAKKLADKAHRLDWWNVKREHTAFEWSAQVAMEIVQPSGDERTDMRMALHTARLLAMQAAERPDDNQFRELVESLQFYLVSNKPAERLLTPAQVKALLER